MNNSEGATVSSDKPFYVTAKGSWETIEAGDNKHPDSGYVSFVRYQGVC